LVGFTAPNDLPVIALEDFGNESHLIQCLRKAYGWFRRVECDYGCLTVQATVNARLGRGKPHLRVRPDSTRAGNLLSPLAPAGDSDFVHSIVDDHLVVLSRDTAQRK
jgi:hypothetical protein